MRATIDGQELRIIFAYGKAGTPFNHAVECYLLDANGLTCGLRGIALCHPSDNFCKETGRKLALARALEGLPKNVRRVVWQAYLNRRNKAVSA